ncbi:hypothetical protein D9M68_905320 [compost metagenome]
MIWPGRDFASRTSACTLSYLKPGPASRIIGAFATMAMGSKSARGSYSLVFCRCGPVVSVPLTPRPNV